MKATRRQSKAAVFLAAIGGAVALLIVTSRYTGIWTIVAITGVALCVLVLRTALITWVITDDRPVFDAKLMGVAAVMLGVGLTAVTLKWVTFPEGPLVYLIVPLLAVSVGIAWHVCRRLSTKWSVLAGILGLISFIMALAIRR